MRPHKDTFLHNYTWNVKECLLITTDQICLRDNAKKEVKPDATYVLQNNFFALSLHCNATLMKNCSYVIALEWLSGNLTIKDGEKTFDSQA